MSSTTTPLNLTARQADAVQAVIDHGRPKRAASALGISLETLYQHLQEARTRTGATTTVQLAARFAVAGRAAA